MNIFIRKSIANLIIRKFATECFFLIKKFNDAVNLFKNKH